MRSAVKPESTSTSVDNIEKEWRDDNEIRMVCFPNVSNRNLQPKIPSASSAARDHIVRGWQSRMLWFGNILGNWRQGCMRCMMHVCLSYQQPLCLREEERSASE